MLKAVEPHTAVTWDLLTANPMNLLLWHYMRPDRGQIMSLSYADGHVILIFGGVALSRPMVQLWMI